MIMKDTNKIITESGGGGLKVLERVGITMRKAFICNLGTRGNSET